MKRVFELINKNILQQLIFNRKKDVTDNEDMPMITISREMGSGGRPIAELVVKKLGKPWKLFHKDLIDKIAKEGNLEKKLVKEIDENRIPLVDEIIGDFFGKRYLSLSNYYKHLLKILSVIGQRGYGVIMGRGAHHLFREALNVRIVCEMHQRIKWEMEFEGLTKTQAVKRVELSDKQRYEFERILYNHDIRKAHHYDLVIRTGPYLSIEEASDIIVFTAKKRFKL